MERPPATTTPRRTGQCNLHTGGVGAEPRVSGISWGALTLEAGKSPTEVTCGRHVPRSLPSSILENASPSSPS
eukprot:scaffold9172_cov52-Phaeocystis_antarctica.AAC.2